MSSSRGDSFFVTWSKFPLHLKCMLFCQWSNLEVDTENSERESQIFFFLARTQLLPLHMDILNIMGDALECLKN